MNLYDELMMIIIDVLQVYDGDILDEEDVDVGDTLVDFVELDPDSC